MTTSSNDFPTHIAIAALAKWFDEHASKRATWADELRDAGDDGYSEQKAVADALRMAAERVWQLIGGRPACAGTPWRHELHVQIALRELGRLVEMAEKPASVATTQPSGNSGQLDEGLVERLAAVVGENGGESLGSTEMVRIAKAFLAPVDGNAIEEHAAQAVLRAFGPALAKQAVAEALGRVRGSVRHADQCVHDTPTGPHAKIETREALRIIDAELASLEAPKPTKPIGIKASMGSSFADALSTLRQQFEFVPKEGDADDGKWVLRADVLNAIDALGHAPRIPPDTSTESGLPDPVLCAMRGGES